MNYNALELAHSFPHFVQLVGEYLGFEVPELHLGMAEALASGDEYIALQAFRNSAKSYLATLYVAWRLMLNPSLWVLVVSGESTRADQFSKSVYGLLQQIPWLKHLAPSRGGKSFTVRGVSETEWPSLMSKSVKGSLRGPRADLIILDDPIGTRDKDSPTVRTKVNQALHEIPLILNPAGRQFKQRGLKVPKYARTRCLALFTPTDVQPNDFYQKADDSFFNRFEVHKFPAIKNAKFDAEGLVESGESAWPERWPFEKLQTEQHANPFTFRVERQVDNSPVEDEKSLVRFGKIPIRKAEPQRVVCFADPSAGGDEYAYAIMGLVRAETGTTIHVLKVGGWRGLAPDDAGRELLDALLEQNVKYLHVEDNYPVSSTLKRMASERNQALVVEPFKTTGRKDKRLKEKLPTMLNSGAVSFDESVLSDAETVRQLRGLRATPGLPSNDDRLDCIEFGLAHFEEWVRHVDPERRKNRAKKVNLINGRGRI